MTGGLIKTAVILALVGAALLAFGSPLLSLLGLPSGPEADAVTVTGTVTATPLGEDDVCSPVVEYVVDGQTYSVESAVASAPCPYRVGEPAEVSYSPDDPGTAHLVSDFGTGQLVRVVFFVVGVGLVVAAVIMIVLAVVRRRRR
jgi:hypothetical protein